MRSIITVFLTFFIFSCSIKSDDKNEESPLIESEDQPVAIFKKGSEVLPELMKTDSLQVLYYDDPYGDPKRYSRYFKYVSTADSSVLNPLLENLNQEFRINAEVTKCHSEGKIYLYKNSEPLKTVYFSNTNDTCSYLYFIKDGLFYEFSLSEQSGHILQDQKKLARQPAPDLLKESE